HSVTMAGRGPPQLSSKGKALLEQGDLLTTLLRRVIVIPGLGPVAETNLDVDTVGELLDIYIQLGNDVDRLERLFSTLEIRRDYAHAAAVSIAMLADRLESQSQTLEQFWKSLPAPEIRRA
ncbi:hypothetical protein PENTCL1PPCAC_2156, partial [Pristionchus entomophagus]